ncbi:MAG TPA: cytochrome c biogenesis protein CcsA [Bryobacteraceae bacterium]|jgi:heme exporter protein C|nr:cytochrome c biogenesis protein CcsA [Bryobacteraceae bacterium]
MRQKLLAVLGIVAGLFLIRNLYIILLQLPDEAAQGPIYRIFFYHLAGWFTSFLAYGIAAAASVYYLAKRDLRADAVAVSAIEIGLAFTAVGMVTGTIWARIIWGIWWTWDPRLTWALICMLMYAGYLMLRGAITEPSERARLSAVVALFSFVTVVITYKAIDWWRTQHPGAVLSFRTGGGRIDPAMESMIFQNFLALLMLATVAFFVRMRQEQMQRAIDALRRRAHSY